MKDSRQYRAYVASPLTGLDGAMRKTVYEFIEVIETECQGKNIFPYIPGKISDPVSNPELSPSFVYQTDRQRVRESDVFILLAYRPSFGAGQEVEIAYNALIPMIILQPQGGKVSRMVSGVPLSLRQIYDFTDKDSLKNSLNEALSKLMPHIEKRHSDLSSAANLNFGGSVKKFRMQRNLSQEDLAKAIGIAPEEIDHLENEDKNVINPSLFLINRISTALNIDPAQLTSPSFYEKKLYEIAEKLPMIFAQISSYSINETRSKSHDLNEKDILKIVFRLLVDQL
jgi:transcriptional regulator with XRE-family HTH domain